MAAATRKDSVAAPAVDPFAFLKAAAARCREPLSTDRPLTYGIDLGTATIVVTAVDASGHPAYWDCLPCEAVRDGVVVNFAEAVAAVRELKRTAEEALGRVIEQAGTAHPPGVPASECRACRYVLEQAGIGCRTLVDEVSAAQALLQVTDGAIADIGGGSTGVGVFRGGRLVSLSDLPGGGRYLDLILAGALGISTDEAERRKRLAGDDCAAILRPGLERIASSIGKQIGDARTPEIHLVGGAIMLRDAGAVIADFIRIKTQPYPHAHLVTPFGIAMS